MARTPLELALKAQVLHKGANLLPDAWMLHLEAGWRTFCHAARYVYRQTLEQALTISETEFSLPEDYLQMAPSGVWLGYTPRTIAAISRATNVVTVQTATAHSLATGMHVAIEDVTPAGSDAFDDTDAEVTVLDTDEFTYANTGANDSGSGGTVECLTTRKVLTLERLENLTRTPEYEDEPGTPSYYAFIDARTLYLSPPSDGETYPALFLEYYAEAPATLPESTDLPIPAHLEEYLIDYAAARAKGAAQAECAQLLGPMVREWRAAYGVRTEQNRQPEAEA